MQVLQLYVDNPLRNFCYLIGCLETKLCAAIDPLDSQRVLSAASEFGWTITTIINTHEHWDHIGGNDAVVESTGASIAAHHRAPIPHVTRPLNAGDLIEIGQTVRLKALDTPGHTMSHVCLLSQGESPALFSGDTLFNAGAGNCYNGGDPHHLYETFAQQLSRLPDNTKLYPGHDYLKRNCEFTLDCESDNQRAKELLDSHVASNPHQAYVTTLGIEREINSFFRLNSRSIIESLSSHFPDLPENPSEEAVFIALRRLRNDW